MTTCFAIEDVTTSSPIYVLHYKDQGKVQIDRSDKRQPSGQPLDRSTADLHRERKLIMSQSRRLSLRYLALDTRNGGCGAIIDHRLYVWGGNRAELRSPYDIDGDGAGNDDTSGYSDSGEEEVSDDDGAEMIEVVTTLPRPRDAAHPFDVYDLRTRTWTRQPTSGSAGAGGLGAGGAADADASAAIPNLGLGSSLCAHLPSKTLYLYGGWKDGKFDGEVYRISTGDWVWEILSPEAERACAPERGNAAGTFVCLFF